MEKAKRQRSLDEHEMRSSSFSKIKKVDLSSLEFIRWILGYIGTFKKKFLRLAFFMILSSALSILPPIIMQVAIDRYILKGNSQGLLLIIISIIFLGVIISITNFLQRYIGEKIGHFAVKKLRLDVYSHLSSLSFSFFDENKTGDLISRVISDSERVRHYFSRHFIELISNTVLIFGIIGLMFFWDYRFGLIFLVFVPILFFAIYRFGQKITPIHRASRKANGILTSCIRDTFDGIREIKIYGQEEQMVREFDKWNDKFLNTIIDSNVVRAKWIPLMPYLLSILSLLFIATGGILYIDNVVSLGLIVGASTYFGLITRPLRQLMPGLHGFNHSKAAAERIIEIMNIEPGIKSDADAFELKNVKGSISFRNINFSYFEGTEILRNINLEIRPGEMVAFVGPSGVGKTTLLSLVTRFYEVKEGEILIDGINIKRCSLKSLRQNIGTLMQNRFLFDGTIEENIKFGKPDATDDQIENAAEIAQIADFIESLPDHYQSFIGERGIKLSGGQAQRLCLARVIVTDPKILILDEPTAEVDAITDEKLISAVRNVMQNRTTLVIAHRLWTIKNADRIVVMRDGKIEDVGSHEELLEKSEFYQQFFASQFVRDRDREIKEGDE